MLTEVSLFLLSSRRRPNLCGEDDAQDHKYNAERTHYLRKVEGPDPNQPQETNNADDAKFWLCGCWYYGLCSGSGS